MAKERLIITQGLCDKVKKLATHGMEQKEIAELLGISLATIGRIKAAGYDAENFKANNDLRRVKDYEKKNHKLEEKAHKQLEEMNKCIEKLLAEDKEEDKGKTAAQAIGEMWSKAWPVQIPGQIQMDLQGLEKNKDSTWDQKSMYAFLAGRFGKTETAICDKLEKINDMLGQILRAIRRE